MLHKLICLILLVSFVNVVSAMESIQEMGLENLSHYAGVLNIEGGRIPKTLNPSKQLWVNYGFVLDTPFDSSGLNHAELTKENRYPLKEASIPDYNEAKVNLFTLASLKYYINHAHELLGCSLQETLKIGFFVHRGTTGPVFIERNILPWVVKQVGSSTKPFSFYWEQLNVQLELLSGYTDMDRLDFSNYDIVISWSLFAGIDPIYKTSDLIIPNHFIPYELGNNQVQAHKKYFVDNHLFKTYGSILQGIDGDLLEWVHKYGQSSNKNKVVSLESLFKIDAHISACLEASGLFNPKKLPKYFDVVLP